MLSAFRISLITSVLFLVSNLAFATPEEISDPAEDINRGVFWFNDKLDVNVLEPVARGYNWLLPKPIKKGVGNFFENLQYPAYLVSDTIQGKFDQVGLHTKRFLINTTIGVLGLIDIAKEFGYEKHVEDFGVALAYHGVPAGPYLVLPIIGPSNVRDGVGLAVDSLLNPLTWLTFTNMSSAHQWAIQLGARGLSLVHTRAGLIQAIETGKESSMDYYLFVQGAYYQYRHGLLTDGKDDEESDEEEFDSTKEVDKEDLKKKAIEKEIEDEKKLGDD